MQRLQIRAYRPVGQSDNWSLIGIADKPEKVSHWLEEFSWHGLILHTGFTVLSRDVMLELLPSARDGLVLCAATKAILPEVFSGGQTQVCHGLEEDGSASLEGIGTWFFFICSDQKRASFPDVQETPATWRLTCQADESSRNQWLTPYEGEATNLTRALSGYPDLLNGLTSSGIFTVEDFHFHWKKLPDRLRLDAAQALMQQAQEPYLDLIQSDHRPSEHDWERQCEAIIAIAPYMPDWDKDIPRSPVRLYNALQGHGVKDLHGLSTFSPIDILKVPNLGKNSMVSLFDHLIRYKVLEVRSVAMNSEKSEFSQAVADVECPAPLTLEELPAIGEAIAGVLQDLERTYPSNNNRKGIRILSRRFAGETLENIGEDKGLTRERIRQIAEAELKRFITKLYSAGSQAAIDFLRMMNLVRELMNKDGCSQIEVDNLIRIFSESETFDPGTPQRRYLEKLFGDKGVRFISLKLASTEVAFPVPESLPAEIKMSLDRTLDEFADSITGMSVKEAQDHVKTVLMGNGLNPFIASALAIETVIYRASIDEKGFIEYKGGRNRSHEAGNAIVKLLREAGRPLHGVSEIYPAMPEIYRDNVNERRIPGTIEEHQSRCPSNSPDYIFGMSRGHVGLWEHTGISDSHGSRCAQFLEQHVNKRPNHQFSDHELYRFLKKEGMVTWDGDRIDKARYVSMILMRYRPRRVRYLGRFVWQAGAWTDERDTSGRYQIHDLIADFIKDKNHPVTKQQIDDYIRKLRGRGVAAPQYQETHGLVRLSGSGKNTLYWHESLDPQDYGSESVKALRFEIADFLRHSSGLLMSGLKAGISRHSDVAANYNTVQFLALLLRMPEVRVKQTEQNKILVYASRDKIND